MSGERLSHLRSIETLLRHGSTVGADDGVLLERFAIERDGEALAAIVDAHGPMVLGVCRRVLRRPQEIDDAFQSTFLVLARRAGSIRDPGRLGPWLHGVAWRVASRVRRQARAGGTHDMGSLQGLESRSLDPPSQAVRNEIVELIDREVDRLPAQYRDVLVLCDLEGRSYADAARQLRCPLGTIQSRLARGRDRLRQRLAQVGISAGAVPVFPSEFAPAPVPIPLREAVIRSVHTASGIGTAAGAGALMIKGALRSLGTMLPRIAVALVLTVGTFSSATTSGELHDEPLAAGSPRREPPPVAADHEGTIEIEVRAAEGNLPLSGGAAIWVEIQGGRSRQPTLAHTDVNGRYVIELPEGPIAGVTVAAGAEGFVPKEVRWPGTALPEHAIIGLDTGAPISVQVVDEEQKPIGGAEVLPGNVGEGAAEVSAVSMDAQGRWKSFALISAFELGSGRSELDVLVRHPDYATTRHYQKGSIDELRRGPLTLVMRRGVSLSGRVIGPNGQPFAGALVTADERSQGRSRYQTRTDEAGEFRFGRCLRESNSAFVSVQSPGLAAHARELIVTRDMPPQVFALERPRPLHGRVVDTKGGAVAGATVSPSSLAGGRLDWGAVTDAQGRFEWTEAPTSGTIRLDVFHTAFEQALGRSVEPDRRDIAITLHRPLHLHGKVTDAVSGQPVERFSLIPGWGPHVPGADVQWLRGSAQQLGNGRFDLTGGLFPDQGMKRSIRIEADGYSPAELTGFLDDAEEIAQDFKLVRSVRLSGIVRDRDGRAMAGAMVGLSGPGNHLRIVNGRLQTDFVVGGFAHDHTGSDARYAFPPQEASMTVVAVHDAGFAIRTPEELASRTDLTLSPWGVIEGVLKIGANPAPRQKVSAWMLNQSFRGRVDYDTITDDQGRFRFDRVTPGIIGIYREVTNQDNRGWTASNSTFVELGAGQHVEVQVGGVGRPIVGRLQVPQGFSLANLVAQESHLTTTRRTPHQPDNFPEFTSEESHAWYARFYKTPEGKAYCMGERQFAVALSPDGAFRAEDVPPGDYEVRIHFRARDEENPSGLYAAAHGRITVPAIPGGRSDEPLDCGSIRLDVFRVRDLKVGDPVPAVTRNLADGRPLDLGALRGKVVLLHIWETYQPRGGADLPVLKETWQAFASDPRFVLIGLNQDSDFDLPRRYAAWKGLGWEQRYLGVERPNPVSAALGVRYPPQVLLIGPDGRLLAKDLQGPAIREAVARALGMDR